MNEDIFQFENLRVWQESVEYAKLIYELTNEFPKHEQFGLSRQLRKAAVSISLNIAEGKGRFHKKEYIQFLYIARGSLYETVSCLKLAIKFNYLNDLIVTPARKKSILIHKQINKLVFYLKNN